MQLIPKNLVCDLKNLHIGQVENSQTQRLNNIASMSLGPTLSDGRRSVVFASDTPNTVSPENTKLVSFALDTTSSNLQLHYINQIGLPFDCQYTDPNGITYRIGGLSGIDYDPKTDTYLVESDHQTIDGASLGYSVMFRVKLNRLTDKNEHPTIEFLSAQPLVNEKGNPISDAESIRLDPNGNGFWYTTEEKPAGIYHYHQEGSVTKIAVPDNITTRAQDNLSLEGSSFAPDGSYYVSMERNLTGDATGYSRIMKYDANGNIVAQYAYYTDRPSTIGATSNGISEILSLDNNTLLIMERGDNKNQTGVTEGASRNRVRIYKVSLINAQNVLDIDYLAANNTKLLDKTKIFDSQDSSIVDKLNTNETKIDNIEGMTLGPKLPDGRQSLILVSDNNFNQSQYKTQFISLVLDDGDACF
ncbi:esterase-like activity of phytase family protein [Commensalibacter nepenthis]|uniref:Esterase-like activity of phytase family protein n=1 Tax=Commensalibacter nepenthis TaxID=3043872 RepID=A0ABT6Q945_9PROT|nr:esterase-like activity of phytase family protein [Commensalibacter sp. TBRC 10068]MDI2113311.1 esterase-like activity of phytase family protein [Commensalibacter sp. TBRC 10068]